MENAGYTQTYIASDDEIVSTGASLGSGFMFDNHIHGLAPARSIACTGGELLVSINGVETTLKSGDPEISIGKTDQYSISALQPETSFSMVQVIIKPELIEKPAPVEEPAPVVPE